MVAQQLLVGPIPIGGGSGGLGAGGFYSNFSHLFSRPRQFRRGSPNTGAHRSTPHSTASSSSSRARINGHQTHYAVLGLTRYASSAEIKKAYRLLARKYHPDVSKDSQAGEVFKSIRQAYEVLSHEGTRTQYDQELKFQQDMGRQYKGKWNYSPEFEDGVRIYRWADVRQKMQRERHWEHYNVKDESSPYGKTDEVNEEEEEEEEEEEPVQERSSFSEVLRSAFISLFLFQTFGSRLSLSFSSLMALFDRKLDAGYKIGYVIAWVLGGRGGILLSLCLSFASWVCGKTSSSMVALVVIAMWVGSNLARFAPLPQGALLTLLYMSIKLQVDLN